VGDVADGDGDGLDEPGDVLDGDGLAVCEDRVGRGEMVDGVGVAVSVGAGVVAGVEVTGDTDPAGADAGRTM
jgi:hypothetical protein